MNVIQMLGDIPTTNLKQDYIRIENNAQYKLDIKNINPLDEDIYLSYWRNIKKIIVEGYWGKESGGYRFCSPNLMWYRNFGLIQDTDESKTTIYIKPLVEDLEWEQGYMYFEASGFSGFYKDEEYTSDILAKTYNYDKLPKTRREKQLFNSEGKAKEYIDPRENIRRLHKYPKGQALYFNEAGNTTLLGTRGGGKSYFWALGECLHQLVIDGGQYYDSNTGKFYDFPDYKIALDGKQHPKVELILGSGDTDKSSELFAKIVANMNAIGGDPQFGCWNTPDDADFSPCPLFKDMSGSSQPGNKKNPYRHEYKIIKNGRELRKGTGSLIYHASYSTQKGKGKGAQAGAGGRYKRSGIEEIGLVENYINILGSNSSAVSRNGIQFGEQNGFGTSGNIDAIPQTMKVFLNPQDYNMLAYDDVWEGMGKDGKICFFLPFYMTLRQYKDHDGNTDYQKAFEHIYKIRHKAANSSDPKVLRDEKMNRPIVPSEMWITQKGHYLPHAEAVQREKELVRNKTYLNLANPVNLIWDSNYPNGIRHEVDLSAEPFFQYPLPTTLVNYDSSIVIYDFPKDNSPRDFYFLTHDPYVSDNIDKGGSFGATHVWINPKYWDEYMPETGPMVATYIAKPTNGLKGYYLEQEKLIAFYNSPLQGLAYEANRGSNCKNYYFNKQKTHVLSLRPQVFDKSSVFLNRITEYGYMTTNVIEDLDRTNDLLLQYLPTLKKRVIETIPCLFTIKQIILFNLKENFDAVSSIMIAPKHIGVLEQERNATAIQNRKKNELSFFSTNKFLNSGREHAR